MILYDHMCKKKLATSQLTPKSQKIRIAADKLRPLFDPVVASTLFELRSKFYNQITAVRFFGNVFLMI